MSNKQYQEIISKFLINLPIKEIKNHQRYIRHFYKAFYYYLDKLIKYKPSSMKDQKNKLKIFHQRLMFYCPKFLKISFKEIQEYDSSDIPTCGAIIINEKGDKIFYVGGRYTDRKSNPKGKIDQGQSPFDCAVREVLEQTGLKIHDKINKDEIIDFTYKNCHCVYFVARNVSQNSPITKDPYEIDWAGWMDINQIEKDKKSFTRKTQMAWQLFKKKYNIEKNCKKQKQQQILNKIVNKVNPFWNIQNL